MFRIQNKFQIFILFASFSHTLASSIAQTKGNCTLPNDWIGSWSRGDINDAASHINIEERAIYMDKFHYHCIQSMKDFYIFQEFDFTQNSIEEKPCYKCILLTEKHPNIIFYRISTDCNDVITMDTCLSINTDDHFLSLYRTDAKRVPCPFGDKALTFNYKKSGNHFCKYKESGSYVSTCSDSSLFLLNYEGCVDNPESGHLKEEIVCIGSWRENSYNYFVGKLYRMDSLDQKFKKEGFRCFNYAPVSKSNLNNEIVGYVSSRSYQTGSCAEAQSTTVGSLTYEFTVKEENEDSILPFPYWLDDTETTGTNWITLNLTFKFVIHSLQAKIDMVHISSPDEDQNAKHPSYQISGVEMENATQDFILLKATEIVGCKRIPICMKIFSRTDYIIEIQLYQRQEHSTCIHTSESIPHLTYTLVKEDIQPTPCPIPGVYTITSHESLFEHSHKHDGGKACDKNDTTDNISLLTIGCEGRDNKELGMFSLCDGHENHKPKLESGQECIGSWIEGNITYIVVNNPEFLVPGYRCYKFIPNQEDRNIKSVVMYMDSCKSSSNESSTHLNFNISFYSVCGIDYGNIRKRNGFVQSGLSHGNWNIFNPLVLVFYIVVLIFKLI